MPATEKLIREFYGEVPRTMMAYVALKDGKPAAVMGYYVDKGRRVGFGEGLKRISKRELVKLYRVVMEWGKASPLPVQVLADPEVEGSENLLAHMGFEHVAQGVWSWRG